MSIFTQQLGDSQNKSVETKDSKGLTSTRENYFTIPKNAKGTEYELLKLSEGLNIIDILPFYYKGGVLHNKNAGAFDYKLDVNVHKNIGTSGSDILSLASLGLADPIADELTNLYLAQKSITSQEEKDKFYNEKIKPLRAKRRCLYIVLHTVDGKRVPKIYETAHFSFEKMIADKLEESKALGEPERVFADPLTGCSIAIMGKKDTFGGHEFIKITSIKFVDRKTPIVKDEAAAIKLVESLPKLDSLLIVKTPQEVKDLMYGAGGVAKTIADIEEEETLSFTPSPSDNMYDTDEEVVEEAETPEDDSNDFNEEELIF